MDIKKAKAFNARMGKAKHYPRHQNLSKGGMVDRAHFADGGDTTQSTAGSKGLGFGEGSVFNPGQALYDPQGFTNAIGGVATGIGAAFTPQNQFQAQLAPTTQLNYGPTVGAGANAALNATPVNSAITAEQGLASQYGDIAAGRGPNPALAQLRQQTGVNVANTAALQAGQRGSAQNVGLAARQIGQQGAATQQNAVGQAATLQAQQQLAALGAEGGLQGQIAQQGLGEQGVGANVYASGIGGLNSQNANLVGNYAQAQGLNQATAQANAAANQKTVGGLLGGIGSVLSFLSEGGEVHPQPQKMAEGGPTFNVDTTMPNPENSTIAVGTIKPMDGQEPGSIVGKILEGEKPKEDSDPTGFKSLGSGIGGLFAQGGKVHPGPHKSHVANYLFAEGGEAPGKVRAIVSPKEVYLSPHQVKEVVERGADPIRIGHHFPGHDKVRNNSQKNDVIPVTLEDGGVVLPISVTTHKDAANKGRKFVEKAHAKRHMKKPKGI